MQKKPVWKQGKDSGRRQSTRGESMVVAVVLMLVFFLLGLAVLTGASVTNAGVNARVRYRQAYYYARSVLDVLDDSLQSGALGDYIRNYEVDQLPNTAGATLLETREMIIPVGLEGANAPADLTLTDGGVKLRYDVAAERLTATYASVSLENVVLSFSIEYSGRSYSISATYSYTGFVTLGQAQRTWDDQWRVRGLS